MGYYRNILSNLNKEQATQGWHLRIAINPKALEPQAHVENIRRIIKDVCADYAVNAMLFELGNEFDPERYNNGIGIISHLGKDVSVRGQEVVIQLADVEHALTADQYKTMLTQLWSRLAAADIPLMYQNTPGFKTIKGPNGLQTPFAVITKDWDAEHPVLTVEFSEKDLKSANIPYDVLAIDTNICNDYHDYQKSEFAKILKDVEVVANPEPGVILTYSDLAEFADFAKHTAVDAELKIDWSTYLGDNNIETLVRKNPAEMQSIYHRVVRFELEKLAFQDYCQNFELYWKTLHPSNSIALDKLKELSKLIDEMDPKLEVAKKFGELEQALFKEMIAHEPSDLMRSPLVVVMDHFIDMAIEMNEKKYTLEELTESFTELDNKLKDKEPLSKKMLTVIGAVVGAIVGALLGVAVGLMVSFFVGGFGAIPGAVIGAVIGGTAGVAAVTGGTLGFFSAKKQNELYAKDKESIDKPVDALKESLRNAFVPQI